MENDTEDHAPFLIRIVDRTTHADVRVSYDVQISDQKIHRYVEVKDLPFLLIIRYWHNFDHPYRNPFNQKKGPQEKED